MSVLLENTPLVKFIRNYIRDLSDLFSIISLVKILMISLKSSLSLIVLKFVGVWSQHLWVFFESLQQSSEIFGTTTLWVLFEVASPTMTPSSSIRVPTALPVLASPFVVLPYVRGVSERILWVLCNNGVKVGYKPSNVLRTCFPRPKDKPPALQCRGVVYKIGCIDYNFVYYGQTDRAF